ncbi:MAG: hypothetical protein HKN33_00570 [Pyrinomonadaceae bacterium]|nr:hypothetical protein [Pyrinomonadaceae bacterium]
MPTIQINGVVHQRQLNRRACWYTCLQMAVRYFESQAQASVSGLSGPEHFSNMQARFAAGSNPSWAEWREWAQQCGFTALNLTPTPIGIHSFLSQHGPIIYSGTWGYSFDGHVVIVTGINTDTDTLYVDDPLEAGAPVTKNMTTYFGNLRQTLWENPLFVYQP